MAVEAPPWERKTENAAPWTRRRSGRTVGSAVQDAGLGAADMLTFGWGDEAAGLLNEDWKYAWRDASRQAEQRDPLAYYGGSLAAGLIPGAGLLSVAGKVGRAAPVIGGAIRGGSRVLSSPGLELGGRMAAGSLMGAVGGGVAGAGFADENDRLQGALAPMAFGGVLGGAAPLAGKALGGMFRREAPPTSFTARSGEIIEGATPAGAGMAPPINAQGGALDDFVRTMARGPRRTMEDLEAYIAQGQADPGRGRTFMDAFGRAGTKRARSEFSKPGQGADMLEAQLLERARGTRGRIEREVSGVTDGDPLAALNAQIDDIAKEELGPWFAKADPAAAGRVLEGLKRRPSVDKALAQADTQIEEHIAAGMLPASAQSNPVYRLHYARMVLQDGVKDPTRLATSLRNMSNANLVGASNAITSALDTVTPGYRAALDSLRSRMQPRSMVKAARVAQRTDRSNVAGNMLGQPQVRQAIDGGGMEGFGQSLRTEDQLFRNSSHVLAGSDTASNVGELLSQGVAASQQAPTMAGAVQGAWRATFGQLGKELFGDMSEQRSNDLVRLMLQKVDDPDPAVQSQVREFLAQLRNRITQMERQSARSVRDAAELGGGFAGYGGQTQEF